MKDTIAIDHIDSFVIVNKKVAAGKISMAAPGCFQLLYTANQIQSDPVTVCHCQFTIAIAQFVSDGRPRSAGNVTHEYRAINPISQMWITVIGTEPVQMFTLQ